MNKSTFETLYNTTAEKVELLEPVRIALPKVSIVIPVYNQCKYTKNCLEAIESNTKKEIYEVIVVDNASSDDTQAFLASYARKSKIIRNENNLGFAKACNQGAKAARGKYILFLNNDTIAQKNWLHEMLKTIEADPSIGVVGSKLLFPDGTIQHAGVVIAASGFGYHLYRGLPGNAPCANIRREFRAVTGACLMIDRDLFHEIGGFDERYINGCEDTDLCLRVIQNGRSIVYNPRSVLIHHEGQSENRESKMDYNRKLFLSKWPNISPDDMKYLQEDNMKMTIAADGAYSYGAARVIQAKLISIVIVTYNSQNDIQRCVQSIQQSTELPYEIIVVDNNSTDNTIEQLKSFHDVKVVFNPKNRGFSAATNQGIDAARGDYVVFLNPDTMVTKGWATRMAQHFDNGVGAVGPVSNYVAGAQKVVHYISQEMGNAQSLDDFADKLYQQNRGKSVNTLLLIGFCMMVRKSVLDCVGGLDEDLFLGNDDLELSLRLRLKGFELRIATDAFVYHKGQASFKTVDHILTDRLVQESTDILYMKLTQRYGLGAVPSSMDLWAINWFKPNCRFQVASPMTSIIVLTLNQIDYSRKCIDSLLSHTGSPFELIIVDNGSTDGTLDYLKNIQRKGTACVRIHIIENSTNAGFSRGNNQGLLESRGQYVVFLNNDVVVSNGWLDTLIRTVELNRTIGLTGPVSNRVAGRQNVSPVSYDEELLKDFDPFSRRWATEHRAQVEACWRLVGFCLLVKREVIDAIGGFDEQYGIGNFEDDDFCIRANLAGFRGVIAKDCFVHHFGGRTFKALGVDYSSQMKRNWHLFRQKWSITRELTPDGTYSFDRALHTFNPEVHRVELNSLDAFRRSYRRSHSIPDPIEFTVQQPPEELHQNSLPQAQSRNQLHAIDLLKKTISKSPDHASAHNDLGVLYYELGDMQNAFAHYKRAAELEPENTIYLKNLADFFFVEYKDRQKAMELNVRILALDPKDVECLMSTGYICVAQGLIDDACTFFDRALDIAPWNKEATQALEQLKTPPTPDLALGIGNSQ